MGFHHLCLPNRGGTIFIDIDDKEANKHYTAKDFDDPLIKALMGDKKYQLRYFESNEDWARKQL